MKLFDAFKLSFDSLRHRKLRSWLTIIGIIIGVAAVVTLISLAEGVNRSITGELSFFGADMVNIVPGKYEALEEAQFGMMEGKIGNLTENDLRIIKGIPGVIFVSSYRYETLDVSYAGQTASTMVTAVDPETFDYFPMFEFEKGRAFVKGDTYSVILGYDLANNIFKKPIELNGQIKIGGKSFRVIGILKQGGFFGTMDTIIFIPETVGDMILETDKIDEILVKLSSDADPDHVVEQIQKKLLLSHHVRKEDQDFTIITAKSVEETVGRITATMTFLFGGIAAISLLVGGIGIANTMFMSVMERIRQIGILKALGATNSDVTKLFLIESGLIGLVGGVIGIFFGYIGSLIISGAGASSPVGFSIQAAVTPQLVLFAMGFSIAIGVLSGIFPARKAAKLQPVEALRYE